MLLEEMQLAEREYSRAERYRMLLSVALAFAHDQHRKMVAQQATIDGQRDELRRYTRGQL